MLPSRPFTVVMVHVAAACSYIWGWMSCYNVGYGVGHAPTQTLRCMYGVNSTQKHKSSLTLHVLLK